MYKPLSNTRPHHGTSITARFISLRLCVLTAALSFPAAAFAAEFPHVSTPEYKVSYYAFDCFNMIDENGKRYGYGYEMMQKISNYMQCTFSYSGYDKTAAECVELLRNGELDIYTAAQKTPERETEFAFSTHPAITAYTCMGTSKNRFKKGKWVECAECDESLLVRLYALRGGATRCCRAKEAGGVLYTFSLKRGF